MCLLFMGVFRIIRDGQTGKRAFDVSNKVGLDLVTDVDQVRACVDPVPGGW